jgi:hypothetical protein
MNTGFRHLIRHACVVDVTVTRDVAILQMDDGSKFQISAVQALSDGEAELQCVQTGLPDPDYD